MVALAVDLVYLLIEQPETTIETIDDVLQNGVASPILAQFEDTVEEYLGSGFTHMVGTETLSEILDNFWLHFGLQLGIVAPLTVLLTFGKVGIFIGSLVLFIVELLHGASNQLLFWG